MQDFTNATWLKATKSNANPQGNCVEVARDGDAIGIRDSKHPGVALLTLTPAELEAFVDGARNGEFDHLI